MAHPPTGQAAVTAGVAFTFVTLLANFITLATGGANAGGVVFNTRHMLAMYGVTLFVCGLLNSGPVKVGLWAYLHMHITNVCVLVCM